MAHKPGKSFNYDGWYFDWFDDDLHGEPEGDLIEGLGGNDNIWGEGGADEMYGGAGEDHIYASASGVVAAWGEDFADGGYGHDVLDFGLTTSDVELWGGGDGDWVGGGYGNDTLYGEAPGYLVDYDTTGVPYYDAAPGDDKLFGWGGNDKLFGGEGNDKLFGGDGNDYLNGGDGKYYSIDHDTMTGGDGNDVIETGSWTYATMTGGSGHDTFVVHSSPDDNPHQITDFQGSQDRWNGAWDTICVDYGPDVTASNYVETMIAHDGGYNLAKSFAQYYIAQGEYKYVFITDSVNGYFFYGDGYGGGDVDVAAILDGLDELSDFGLKNVVNDFDSPF